ncbi:shikimate dehydrogenase [Azospirillum sp. RWY-5-1]|uniref:Shikimate dehydrogenase n=1 Tax=Azospirillum oleiclasticum TaxID=2735135 RepID=A0ABX2TMM8_9PROT|nr:shikimate dehydrogenase [Azospirillum oleiclasticum]NYZ17641.1 shikimate dehydrogenase [Azospirillum oleiclasticum]NYZ24996.1 shikimate dehydrogenase [Azospirillum oleiclasticum]
MTQPPQPNAVAIDGATRILAIVGDPIVQAKSPLLYNPRIARAGRNAVLVPWHAPEAHFDAVMAGLMRTGNVDGIVVTFPFKQRAMALADRHGRMAGLVGALNALRREADGSWTGDMFDGVGLVRAVAATGASVAGRRVKLLGAGGAGSAIAYALADAGAASVSIFDRDTARAAATAAGVTGQFPGCAAAPGGPELGDVDLLVNATTVGLAADDGLPVPLPDLSPATLVVDIVPRTGGTALLAFARDRGCPHVAGPAMVEGQADAVLEFFGISAAG